ncbi:MOSC domain-containing protein [Salinisphaera sp. Q1T1-3]|uniref:MOSC domain-containing protein n=1 Tax=Salinisphaera sp. Q1T1-3 TaxID=2321229 RepID=UPI000E76E304|nr:MOSC N-terminal beta barrel domain-containing protein [Salinisphaera sp. Q1T1-3]RJS91518.1 MOSC domain-containing protein [Salinisphaera sp. Q1T1-3]
MAELSAIYRYPMKSGAGEALRCADVAEEGLIGDRRFMVVRPDGRFLTARVCPGLQRIVVRFDGTSLSLEHDTQVALRVRRGDFAGHAFSTGVWRDAFDAMTTTHALDAWVSRVVGEPVHLLYVGERSARYRDSIGVRVGFADGYPLLLTSEASLADVNARTMGDHVMAQFRPNVVVAGISAYAEDDWRRIRIGEVVFRVDKPCTRCVMITVDPARGERRADGEPLRTLGTYRKFGKDVCFGQNLVAESAGRIVRGDPIEILE